MQQEEILNEEEMDQLMPTLTDAFKTIYNGKSTDVSYNDTYRAVYRLCKKGMYLQIVNELIIVSQQHFENIFKDLKSNGHIFETFKKAITRCNEEINRIMEILLYVETNYYHQCKRQYNSLKDMLNNILYKKFSSNQAILKQISNEIAKARIAGQNDKINEIIEMINQFDGKSIFFEKALAPVYEPLLVQHYAKVSEDNFQKLTQKQYLITSRKLIQGQREWLKKNFMTKQNKSQITRIMVSFYNAVVTQIKQKIYKKDPESLFKENTLQFLELLREKGDPTEIDSHNQWFMEEIKKRLQSLDKINNTIFLQKFIDIYYEVSNSLTDLKEFTIRYKAIFFFQDWINDEKLNLPRRINFYIQQCIHKKLQIEACLKNFKDLFKFLKQKDLFEKMFRSDHAMRLIYCDYDHTLENLIIKEMDNQCGIQWLQKIHKTTTTLQLLGRSQNNLMNVICFEDSIWPLDKGKIVAVLPKRLINMGKQFLALQQVVPKLNKIKVQFHPSHGSALITIKFKSCSQDCKLTTGTLSLLLHLQQLGNTGTIKNIMDRSYYTLQQLQVSIKQLQQAKILDLQGNIDTPTSTITLNSDFSSSVSEIDLTKKNSELNTIFADTQQEILQPDRKTMVSALLIKSIKGTKITNQQALLESVKPLIEARGFQFNPKFVINVIKDLIDRDFIKENQNGNYEYVPV